MSGPSLCSLPIECKQMILCRITDVETLKAIILSHSALYDAFCDRKGFILRNVVSNVVSPELLAYAIFRNMSYDLEGEREMEAPDLLDLYQRDQFQDLCLVSSVKEALVIEKYHQHVVFFANDFISVALSKTPVTGATEEESYPPSPSEYYRVARSIYIHEIMANLFSRRLYNDLYIKSVFTHIEPWDIFFCQHALWELEQLSCISEYLYRRVSPVFNEIAAHDVEWGWRRIHYADNEVWEDNNPHKLACLLDGLPFLHRAVTAETYEERYKLFPSKLRRAHWAVIFDVRLFVLKMIYTLVGETSTPFKDLDPETTAEFIGEPLGPESDSGPKEAWQWAYTDSTCFDLVYSSHHQKLRRQGYVMWDHSRLESWGISKTPFQTLAQDYDAADADDDNYDAREVAMESSMRRRYILFTKGARGWWSEDDESKLTWEHR